MKQISILIWASLLCLTAHAESYDFWYHRFGRIGLITDSGKEKVFIEKGNKQGEEIVFSAKLKPVGEDKFQTAEGTTFELEKLSKPVVNDGNRHINSGDIKLLVTGSGSEYEKFTITPSFGATGKTEFYGEKREGD